MFKVNIDNGRNFVYGCEKYDFEAGDKVSFQIPMATDMRLIVTSEQVELIQVVEKGTMHCSFLMPACDVSISISRESIMCKQMQFKPFTLENMKNSSVGMAIPQNESMYCYDCGAFLPAKAKFCGNCGKRCRD